MARRVKFMDQLMSEPIRLPGAQQVIVTRGWAYQWLKKLGYETDCRKGNRFNTVEYMTMARPTVNEPLTDLTQPHIVSLIALMESHA